MLPTWNKLFEKYGNTEKGQEILIELAADPENVYKTFEELDSEASEKILTIDVEVADTATLLSQVSSIQSVLSSQATGSSIDYETFNSEELADYQSALEWVNGTLQLNTEKVRELTEAKVEEQIATNDATKAQEQQKYKENVAEIEKLRREYLQAKAAGEDYTGILTEMQQLQSDNSSIASQCQSLDLLNASLRESIGAYQAWKDAQNMPESGDMFDDTKTMWEQIREVSDPESDNYMKVGNETYQAAVDFLVPDTVDHADQQAVSDYLDGISKYLMFDDGDVTGVDLAQFMQDSCDKGLMYLDEESGEYKLAGERSMQEFADGLGLSLPFVQAIFGELEEYLPEGKELVWTDSEKSLGDMAVAAGEAANALGTLVGFENVDIQLDVSEFETKEEKIAALQDTIDKMNGIMATPGIDATQMENAKAIIEYCVAQMQILNNPVVMRVDTSSIENEATKNAITALQELVTAQNTLEANIAMGADTTQAEADVAAAVENIKNQQETMLTVGIQVSEETTAESIMAQLQTQDEEIYVNVGAKIEDAEDAINSINKKDVDDKTFSVTAKDYSTGTINRINKLLNGIKDKTVTITTKHVTTSSYSSSGRSSGRISGYQEYYNGTAHAAGTACAGGNWGTKKSGTALVGELGREIVVNPATGRWYTVGDNGAEFVNLPKGSIIFNHLQTTAMSDMVKQVMASQMENVVYFDTSGTAVFNGTIYSSAGEIGNWIISKYTIYAQKSTQKTTIVSKPMIDENGDIIYNTTYATDTDGNPVYETDENGNIIYEEEFVYDEDGNPVYATDEDGNIIYDEIEGIDEEGTVTYFTEARLLTQSVPVQKTIQEIVYENTEEDIDEFENTYTILSSNDKSVAIAAGVDSVDSDGIPKPSAGKFKIYNNGFMVTSRITISRDTSEPCLYMFRKISDKTIVARMYVRNSSNPQFAFAFNKDQNNSSYTYSVIINSNGILPYFDRKSSLGSSSNRWKYIYGQELNVDKVVRLPSVLKMRDDLGRSRNVITLYHDGKKNNYGSNLVISAAGNTFIGSGNAPSWVYKNFYLNSVSEHLALCSDASIRFYVNCQKKLESYKFAYFDANLYFKPYETAKGAIGSSAFRWNNAYFEHSPTVTSDARHKTDIKSIDKAKELIMAIKPCQYRFKRDEADRVHYGIISQEFKQTLDELGIDCGAWTCDLSSSAQNAGHTLETAPEEEKMYGMRYEELIAPIIQVIQEQQMEIDKLKETLNQLTSD